MLRHPLSTPTAHCLVPEDWQQELFLPEKAERVSLCLVAQSCPTLCDPWSVDCQAPLSMEFPRQEYWSGLLFTSPGDLPDSRLEPGSPALQEDSLPT